jgi:hypothetical protein
MSGRSWNEIVKAYDQQFHLLETARAEYGKMIDSIMSRLGACNHCLEGDTTITHSIIEAPFGRKSFRSTVKIGDIEWCAVIGRMAAPWADEHQEAGTFTIAVEYTPQSDYLPTDTRSLLQLSNKVVMWSPSAQPSVPRAGSDRWLHVQDIDLNSADAVTSLIKEYGAAVESAVMFASVCQESALFAMKGRNAMVTALAAHIDHPVCAGRQTTDPNVASNGFRTWHGFKYFEIKFGDLPSIWFFIHPGRRSLMFSHSNDRGGVLNLAQVFAGKIGVRPEKIVGSPAGVLCDEATLLSLTEKEISDKIIATTKLFYDSMIELNPR